MATLSTTGRNAACNAVAGLFDASGAVLTVLTTASAEVCSFTLGATPFGAAATGVASLGSQPSDASPAGGAPDTFTLQDSASAVHITGTAGVGDEIVMSASIATTDTVTLTALTLTMPA